MTDQPGLESTYAASTESADQRGAAPELAPGSLIGRFRIVERLGEGGMGVVFRAVDLDLERDIALKLLRTSLGSSGSRQRLLDEARAMAKLRHSNVVTVHEIGTEGDRDFIAMELFGGTLSRWLATPRDWRAVLAVFVAAGRGLEAAHAAGVVHRDFKPGNVLIGDDGRTAVSDFGLAVHGRDVEGEVAGTPAYMSPEQRAGGPLDARSDQFSFCVALREALPAAAPARVRRAVARGLAEDRSARFPSMRELLAELETAVRRGAGGALAIFGACVALAMVLALVLPRRTPAPSHDPCHGDPLAAVWGGGMRGAVGGALAGRPQARTSVLAELDAYVGRWRERWFDVCLGDRPAGSPEWYEEMACLLDARDQAAAQVGALSAPSPALLDGALAAVQSLPDPALCVAGDGPRLPDDPALRDRVRTVEAELARVRGRFVSHDPGVVEAAAAAVTAAREVGHPPLIAAALFELGRAELRAEEVPAARSDLADAVVAAEEAGDDELRARALVSAAQLEIRHSSDDAAVRRAIRTAAAAVERQHRDTRLRADLLRVEAELAARDGDVDGAVTRLEEAAALYTRAGARIESSEARFQEVGALRDGGFPERALPLLDAELAALEQALGADDPGVTFARAVRADLLRWLGRYDEAHAQFLAVAPPGAPRGAWHLTGTVVDAAGAPVAGAEVVLLSNVNLYGDGGFAYRPVLTLDPADAGLYVVRTGADGRFAAQVDAGRWTVIAEDEQRGRSPSRHLDVAADSSLDLALAPWATVHGTVSGSLPPLTHVHLTLAGEDVYHLEVVLVNGAYHARVPAGTHSLQVLRNEVAERKVIGIESFTLAPGEDRTLDVVLPDRLTVIVHIRGEGGVDVPHAGVLLVRGAIRPAPKVVSDIWPYYQSLSGVVVSSIASPERGGSVGTLTDVLPGDYTLCVAAVAGDFLDPAVRNAVLAHSDEIAVRCRAVHLDHSDELTMPSPAPIALTP